MNKLLITIIIVLIIALIGGYMAIGYSKHNNYTTHEDMLTINNLTLNTLKKRVDEKFEEVEKIVKTVINKNN